MRGQIKPRTNKRTKEEDLYRKNRKAFIEAEKDDRGRVFCIFCGYEIINEPSLHHALGRDDDMLLNDEFWFLSHNICHVHEYHSKSWKDCPWWEGYLNRIEHIPEIYEKEKLRMSKTE